MSGVPFMPLYVGDYMADTQLLTTEESGAYLLILMAMWTHGGDLPADPKKLALVARATPRKWKQIWPALEDYFQVSEGRLVSVRLQKEYQKTTEKRRVNAASGAQGGRAKALKDKERALANATETPKRTLWQSNSISEREKELPNGSSKKRDPVAAIPPDDWEPSDEQRRYAEGLGLTPQQIDSEAESLRDWHQDNRKKRSPKDNFAATWRTWAKRAASRGGRAGPQPETYGQQAARILRGGQPDMPALEGPRPPDIVQLFSERQRA